MKLVSGRVVLDKAVSLVSNALPSKDYGDATSGIMLEVNEENLGVMTLTVNSLEVFIKTSIKLQEEAESAGVVVPNGGILSKIVSNLKNLKNPIELEYDENDDVLSLACGKDYKGSVAHYDSMGFIVPKSLDEIKEYPTISLPVRLIKKAIDEVAFSCSKDKTHPELTGIYFDQNSNGMNIVGTDSLRLSCIQYSSKISGPKSVILSVGHLQLLKKIMTMLEVDDGETIKLHLSEDMAFFVHNDTTIVGFQTLGDSYYDEYSSLLFKQEDCGAVLKLNREHFLEKLDLAVSHNNSSQDIIMLSLKSAKEGLLESKVNSSAGNVNTFSIPFTVVKATASEGNKLKKFSVGINPAFLYDVLGKIKEKEVCISLYDVESGPVVVYPIEDGVSGRYVHVFSLAD